MLGDFLYSAAARKGDMHVINLRFLVPVLAASFLALPGCSSSGKSNSGGASGTDTEGTGSGSESATSTSGGTDSGSGGGSGSTGEPLPPQPDGESCSENDGCISGHCFLVPGLGGTCGECESDADCPDGGCTIPNPLATPPTGSVCNDGTNGGGCETDEVCESQICALILDVSGLLTISTCSDCREDAGCMDGQFCQPTVEIATLSGEKVCVDPGTKPDGDACEDPDATGDDACENFCDPADVMGLVEVGVCGPCDVANQTGCAATETCSPPTVDFSAPSGEELVPSFCCTSDTEACTDAADCCSGNCGGDGTCVV
jgi:hypothetical protein